MECGERESISPIPHPSTPEAGGRAGPACTSSGHHNKDSPVGEDVGEPDPKL